MERFELMSRASTDGRKLPKDWSKKNQHPSEQISDTAEHPTELQNKAENERRKPEENFNLKFNKPQRYR